LRSDIILLSASGYRDPEWSIIACLQGYPCRYAISRNQVPGVIFPLGHVTRGAWAAGASNGNRIFSLAQNVLYIRQGLPIFKRRKRSLKPILICSRDLGDLVCSKCSWRAFKCRYVNTTWRRYTSVF